jgi:hypothetical protein
VEGLRDGHDVDRRGRQRQHLGGAVEHLDGNSSPRVSSTTWAWRPV